MTGRSWVLARSTHGITVGYLSLNKQGTHTVTPNKAKAYRFDTENMARLWLQTLPEPTGYEIQPSAGTPSSRTYPPQPRSRAKYPEPKAAELEPFKFSTGQCIGLTVGAVVVVLFAIALVMGW